MNIKMKKGLIAFTLMSMLLLSSCVKTDIVYCEALDKTAVTVDKQELTLADLAFYVVYEEDTVEKQALIYSADNPKSYWNLHINGNFIQVYAKDTIINMAVRDHIYYKKALEDGVELTSEERKQVESKASEYYNSLTEYQRSAVALDNSKLCDIMEKIALAEKEVQKISDADGVSSDRLQLSGDIYESELASHKYKVNNKVWDRVNIGTVTISR